MAPEIAQIPVIIKRQLHSIETYLNVGRGLVRLTDLYLSFELPRRVRRCDECSE